MCAYYLFVVTLSQNVFVFFQNYSGELNYLVALHELYKYINKYYDQVSFHYLLCGWIE